MLGVLLAVVSTSVGCGGGGSGGSANDVATIQSAPVDLAPGQTSALVAWEPSVGPVDGYLVFKSTNNGSYSYDGFASTAQYTVTGAPGDQVRLFVIARGSNDTQSQSSPPSPPIRFHAAIATTASVASTSTASTGATSEGIQTASNAGVAVASSDAVQTTTTETTTASEANEDPEATQVAPLDEALRDRLLRSGARLPLAALASNAGLWLQGVVDEQVGAGVSLASTGELGGDARRDLVWRDSSGQLFVSDGAMIATTDDVPSTFQEAIRLHSTERVVALDDFDGDGLAEWLIEDTVTGEAWIASAHPGDPTANPVFSAVLGPQTNSRLAGHGDFDGDGRAEILWRNADRSYRVGRPDGVLPAIDWTTLNLADVEAADLLAIADVDADGNDDLIFRDADGSVQLAVARPSGLGQAVFAWAPGPVETTQGLEIIATLDYDADGAAEIAWWSAAGVLLWDL